MIGDAIGIAVQMTVLAGIVVSGVTAARIAAKLTGGDG